MVPLRSFTWALNVRIIKNDKGQESQSSLKIKTKFNESNTWLYAICKIYLFLFSLSFLCNLQFTIHLGLEHATLTMIVEFLLMDLALKIEWHVLPC